MPKIDELVDGGRIQDTDNIPVGRGGDTRRVRVGSAAEADIVGTVSESGGVPTGAIIEQGSNSNGAYTKFADGTMICAVDGLVADTVNSVYLLTGSWTYPAEFSSAPETVLFNIGVGATNQSAVRKVAGISNASVTNTGTSIRVASSVGNDWASENSIGGIGGIAIGRWF